MMRELLQAIACIHDTWNLNLKSKLKLFNINAYFGLLKAQLYNFKPDSGAEIRMP